MQEDMFFFFLKFQWRMTADTIVSLPLLKSQEDFLQHTFKFLFDIVHAQLLIKILVHHLSDKFKEES